MMDRQSGLKITSEQRFLLNAGRGPPFRSPLVQDVNTKKGSMAVYDVQTSNKEVVYNPNSASAGVHVHEHSQHMMMTPPGLGAPCAMTPGFYSGASSANSDRQTPKGMYEQIQTKNNQPKNVQGSISQLDLLRIQNEELRRALAFKSEEVEELRAKLHLLTERLNNLPDFSAGNYADDRLINLATTIEMASGGYQAERRAEDEEDLMMKSVQCSEQSIEQQSRNEYTGEAKGGFVEGQILQVTERGKSSASGASFEVVGKELFCADPKTCFEEGELKKLENECAVDLKQIKNLEDQIRCLASQVKTLEARLNAEHSQRFEAESETSKRLDELSANVLQGGRSGSAENAEFLPLGVRSEMQDQKQVVSELKAANWKLTEQLKELRRENEELKNLVQELRSRATGDVQKLEDELRKKSRQVSDMEDQLQAEHQCLLDAEARIRELELEQTNAGDIIIQHGSDETTIVLTTENAVLKRQIETYKEDFEVERRDREKIISERDTVQRYYETLRSDLDNARQQLRNYDSDISLLRADNSSMRTRLREVTEELSGHKDSKIVPVNTTRDFSPKSKPSGQPQNIVDSDSSSTMTGQSASWMCRACTFMNPTQRTICEMCGTLNDSNPSSSSGVCDWISVPTGATPLSNARQYGRIETD